MNRREFLTIIATVPPLMFLPGLTAANSPQPIAPAQTRPNIVLVMSDDQGWGDTGYNGGPVQTPHLDAMAAESLRFDRFYSAAPVCSPTRASVMTGRHPNRYGCYSWNYSLPETEITLAELLRGAGYATGHFGKWHIGNVAAGAYRTPTKQGFDTALSHHHHFDYDPTLYRDGVPVQMTGDSSGLVADAAIEFIKAQAQDGNPFLAVVWFPNAHSPYEAALDTINNYPETTDETGYYAEITEMDAAIGRLRAELRGLGIHENTLMWFCGDNGGREWLGNTGGRGGKEQLYEGGIRVPALLEWPARITTARASNVPVTTLDILPTLLDVLGVPLPNKPIDGVSVKPLIDGAAWEHPAIGFWQFVGTKANPTEPPVSADAGHAAWLDWPWKLHKIAQCDGSTEIELYNLLADPWEAKNLLNRNSAADRIIAMRADLEAWQAPIVDDMRAREDVIYYGAQCDDCD